MPSYTVAEIAQALKGRVCGDSTITLEGLASLEAARPTDLVIAIQREYLERLSQSRARVAIIHDEFDWQNAGLKSVIVVRNPRTGMAHSTHLFQPDFEFEPGIHASSILHSSTQIGNGASIGPFCYIGRGVHIGSGAKISDHVSIHGNTRIGSNCTIHAGVRIGHGIQIGNNFICHANTVIGSDGYSYETATEGAVDDVRETLGSTIRNTQSDYHKVYSLGSVLIGDDVEIGACSAIDRGTLSSTTIGNGTKLDNLVHVAHNVRIGSDCLLCGQVGIAGSARIGNRVVLAGQTGVKDHIVIGDDVIAGGATKIFTNVPAKKIMMGSPAVEMKKNIAIYKAVRKLPKLVEKLGNLELRVNRLDR